MNRNPQRNGKRKPQKSSQKKKQSQPKKAKSARPKANNFTVQQSAANSYFTSVGPRKPSISSSMSKGDARIRVRHSEYIQEIDGSNLFSAIKFEINPGMSATFPWLSNIAPNYETYRFNSLEFHFRTTRGSNSSGSVNMAIDYDAADSTPTSLSQMLQYHGSVDSPVWSPDTCMRCSNENMNKAVNRYIRTDILAPNLDIKSYDIGNLFIGTAGETGGIVPIGRIWVTYDVDLITPQGRPVISISRSQRLDAAGIININSIFGSVPGTGVGTTPRIATSLNNVLLFSVPGEYAINIYWTGNSGGNSPSMVGSTVTAYKSTLVRGDGIAGACTYFVNVTASGQFAIFDCSSFTTLVDSETYITQCLYAIGS